MMLWTLWLVIMLIIATIPALFMLIESRINTGTSMDTKEETSDAQ